MEDTQNQQQESAAEAPAPPTPAHEEAETAAPQPDNADAAPDADEPGDDQVPEELQEHVHTGDVPPDAVDQEG